MRGLTDSVVIIAGGGSGIGAATAVRLAEEGARVVIGDVNGRAAGRIADTIRGAGGDALAHRFDIAVESDCAALVASAVETYGGVDGLFNVAADLSEATLGRDTDAVDVPLEVWQRSLDVNLTGYLLTARYAIPAMLAGGGGAIVNTISNLVLQGDPDRVGYGASKSGVVALSKHIAARWGRENIRCNVVAPGLVVTDNSTAMNSEEYREAVFEMLRSPRFGRADDIAAAACFLLSADGEWINGQVLPVNGGSGLR